LKQSGLEGTILNTILRDNLHIYYSKNIEKTMDFILSILKNIDKFKEYIKNNNNDVNTSNSLIHVVKKKNMNSETCFLNMICGIPGISNKTGKIIVDRYKNIGNMMTVFKDNLNNNKDDIIKELEFIKVGSNLRKLGSKHASNIYTFLYE
jgi:ERCC4-type nuclease